ncbi:hypothetical protein [Burkholderia stagnalis]|uniref:hypothetical protein n=1 Tax=Burkholderia stagnalis TaxID=1503054 RepID=UPI000F8063C7|nr:hypothetical protein [Burkholderia stagnalis]
MSDANKNKDDDLPGDRFGKWWKRNPRFAAIVVAISSASAVLAGAVTIVGNIKTVRDWLVPPLPKTFYTNTGKIARGWVEIDNAGSRFVFLEQRHDKEYLYLVDNSRNRPGERSNPLMLRVPVKGGTVYWSYANPAQWTELFQASIEPPKQIPSDE